METLAQHFGMEPRVSIACRPHHTVPHWFLPTSPLPGLSSSACWLASSLAALLGCLGNVEWDDQRQALLDVAQVVSSSMGGTSGAVSCNDIQAWYS